MRRSRKIKKDSLETLFTKSIPDLSFREKVIRNVLCYHKHLKTTVHYMETDDLLALTHPSFRERLTNRTW